MARQPGGGARRCSTQVWQPARGRAPSASARRSRRWRCRAASAATIEPWDWRFYAEKVRQRALRRSTRPRSSPTSRSSAWSRRRSTAPSACSACASSPRADIAVYHPDVEVYEVRGADGALIGLFLHDNFARPSKRSGAWMSALPLAVSATARRRRCCRSSSTTTTSRRARRASRRCCSFDDARTLFHEFGHGLHGLLSNVDLRAAVGHQRAARLRRAAVAAVRALARASPRC